VFLQRDDRLAEDFAAHPALARLEPGETVHRITRTTDAHMLVTDRRVAIAAGERLALDIPYHRLRRVQFDLERRRPATLVLVPEHPTDEPQVLAIPRSGCASSNSTDPSRSGRRSETVATAPDRRAAVLRGGW
jgi:hypothetical protein